MTSTLPTPGFCPHCLRKNIDGPVAKGLRRLPGNVFNRIRDMTNASPLEVVGSAQWPRGPQHVRQPAYTTCSSSEPVAFSDERREPIRLPFRPAILVPRAAAKVSRRGTAVGRARRIAGVHGDQPAGVSSPGLRIIFSTSAMCCSSSWICSRAYSSSHTLLSRT